MMGGTKSVRFNAGVLVVCALLLEIAFLAIGELGDLSRQIPEFLLVYLLSGCVYLIAAWTVARPRTATEPTHRPTLLFIWIAAVVFRLTLLPMTPGLSDDLARYRWQGQVQAAGGNPYLATPDAPRWEGLRDSTWPQVTRKGLPSAYGPLLEQSHRWTYRLASRLSSDPERQVWIFKLPFALLELGTGGAVWLLLGVCGLPRERALLYLWSPLIVVEFWAQGHNDSLAVLLVVVALASARVQRLAAAWAALTAAALAKVWPIALGPLLLLQRENGRWRLEWKPLWVVAPVAALAVWPYADAIFAAGDVLRGFAGGWRNNDSLHGWILALSGGKTDAALFWSGVALAAAFAGIWMTVRPRERAVLWSIVALLLLAANCFPWYLSWFAPLLALYPNPALLLWTVSAGLAYHVVTAYAILGVWEEVGFYRNLEYAPVLALLAYGWIAGKIRPKPRA